MKFRNDEYEIEFPEISRTTVEAKTRAWLKKNPTYAKLFLLVVAKKAISITEATNDLCELEGREIDRAEVYRMMKRLVYKGLVQMIHIGDVMRSTHNNEIYRLIKLKYYDFLKPIPEQFRKKFRNIFYFTPTKFGKKFVEWCGEVAKVKVKRLK